MRRSSHGLVIAALVATGCQEAPSYAVRWRVEPRAVEDLPPTPTPQEEEMTNPAVCTRAGVSQVEVWVVDEDSPAATFRQSVAEAFTRPCFPSRFQRPGGAVRGGTLQPGDYTIIVAGTRANDLAWGECLSEDDCPFVQNYLQAAWDAGLELCEEGSCAGGLDSCDCQRFTVVADQLERLPDFVLPAPPDCEDGIDNDEDGLVDQLDPGCQLGDSESTPVLSPEIAIDLSVLSGNPNADCNNVDVGSLGLAIDGEPLDRILCNVGITRFSTPLSVGDHEIAIVGLDGAGGPVTVEKTFDFSVSDQGVTDPPFIRVDFADVDLLDPLQSAVRFTYELALPDGEGSVLCTDDAVGATDFRFRLLDLGGAPVQPAPLSTEGVRLDGSSMMCRPAVVSTLDALSWGGYLLEFEAYDADGELCWSNADQPEPLTPRESVTVVAQPVDGAPASCFSG